ncbi:MAG TPA: SidA/IucD/PvdA family monooxygenase [Actinophytocola sp.]|uniref:SidA/IucD/PvdA family monooxygenase n=1 Tax=Actinophytocola sp. TaxID=1872138 RepID=UPI002DDCBEE3|nr:SidA/IucD/PvdA family monooxygenase [Actinophytocola sp.]HEV2783902.1 SidA/IucD/PvdA family monooxygenase [Actinophytocola sp.]
MSDHDIVVVGAGAKAAAIAAKAHVLNELGLASLDVLIVEHHEPASTWTGKFGFSAGAELLGTRPEKDIGFPYQSAESFGRAGGLVDAAMTRFSWQSYLVSTGAYSRWIDSGLPGTTHTEFAYYLKWVFAKAGASIRLKRAKVISVDHGGAGWMVRCAADSGEPDTVCARLGLIVTGPGLPRRLPGSANGDGRLVSADISRARLGSIPLPPCARVCIVGAGESAVAMALFLLARHGESISVTFVSSSLPYSRLESYLENVVYSQPQAASWAELPEEIRYEFIRRTDRGVMSPAAVSRLVEYQNVSFRLGRVVSVNAAGNRLRIDIEQHGRITKDEFDLIVNCTGFCPLTQIRSLLSARSVRYVEKQVGALLDDQTAIARLIDSSLSLPRVRPNLHVPALSALAQGPGFANLSCLGALSDRVLAEYCTMIGAVGTRSRAS